MMRKLAVSLAVVFGLCSGVAIKGSSAPGGEGESSVSSTQRSQGAKKKSASSSGASQAADIVISDVGKKITRNCKGNNVRIDGNSNVITLRGECNDLVIDAPNTITVEAVKRIVVNSGDTTVTAGVVGRIVFNGSENTVKWRKAAKGNRPEVENNGTNNRVEQIKE